VVKQVRYCDFEFDIEREFVSAALFKAIFSVPVGFEDEMSCRLVSGRYEIERLTVHAFRFLGRAVFVAVC
jgi:hypothetical protein